MASPFAQPAEVVVERKEESVETSERSRFSSPQPAPADTRWVIKLAGNVPF